MTAPAHGTVARSNGKKWNCRCDPCRAASNEYDKQWKAGPGRQSVLRANAIYRAKHPERWRAYKAVQTALERGRLVKPDRCPCGRDARVHAHHEDYSQPLDVVWLCQVCHKARHREMGATQ